MPIEVLEPPLTATCPETQPMADITLPEKTPARKLLMRGSQRSPILPDNWTILYKPLYARDLGVFLLVLFLFPLATRGSLNEPLVTQGFFVWGGGGVGFGF